MLFLAGAVLTACGPAQGIHVYPGDEIQAAIEQAADDPTVDHVYVHEGVYRPSRPGQAMVWLNARHDGLVVEAVGEVVLTAANPGIADPSSASYPAIVNHVVYFGDGISRNTVLRGFAITGANGFVTRLEDPGPVQPDTGIPDLEKELFFYADGGAIKVFGRSYPTIENVEIYENYTSPCGAGISIEHRGYNDRSVLIRNAVIRDNRTQVTGSGIDVLPHSAAEIENCLFVNNISNVGEDIISPTGQAYNAKHGSGALTVFHNSQVRVTRSTFTGNWNGVDDRGAGNLYEQCIFWMNRAEGGISPGGRYEIDILDARRVVGNILNGDTVDLRNSLRVDRNGMSGTDPEFDDRFVPRHPSYEGVGYRPTRLSPNVR